MRVLSAVKFDIMFQIRHGFYYAYLVVSVLYVLVLRNIPLEYRELVAILLIFSDTSALGFFFIGGIVLLEKDQNTLESLFVTPLRVAEYLISKVISLTILAAVMSTAIIALTFGESFNLLRLLTGIILSSSFFTLVGFALSARAKNVNEYLLAASLVMIVFFLPMLDYLKLYQSSVFYLFPTKASIVLMKAMFQGIPWEETAYAVFFLLACTAAAGVWAYRWFYKYIILRIGG